MGIKMNYGDVIKKSVLEGFSYSDMSSTRILVTLGMTLALAVYIYLVYRLSCQSTFYCKSFHVSMSIISVITAGIILAMQSSIVISLGMVGALSIVRFRTAIKDPMDLLFLFWSIGTGIICGAGLYKVAIFLAVLVTVGICLLDMLPARKSPYLLIVNTSAKEAEEEIMNCVKEYTKGYKTKSKNLTGGGMDLIIEIRTRQEKELVNRISELDGITAVSILAQESDVRS